MKRPQQKANEEPDASAIEGLVDSASTVRQVLDCVRCESRMDVEELEEVASACYRMLDVALRQPAILKLAAA
jgi:hypothetical protein